MPPTKTLRNALCDLEEATGERDDLAFLVPHYDKAHKALDEIERAEKRRSWVARLVPWLR